MPRTSIGRPGTLGRIVLGSASLVILAITLWPGSAQVEPTMGFWCTLCGTRGLADGILNVLLFLPIGIVLGLRFGPWPALLAAALVSGLVEGIQPWIPGRYSTLGDLLFNVTGGALGAILATRRDLILRRLLAPSKAVRISGPLLPVTAFLFSALLSAPSYPDRPYYGQWTHDLGHVRPYSGPVLSAEIGGIPAPDERLSDAAGVRAALRARAPVRVSFLTGPPTRDLAHLFAVYDDLRREVWFLGVQGTDLQLQQKVLAEEFKLDRPFLRWRKALPQEVGVQVQVSVAQRGRDLCLSVGPEVRCDLAPGVEQGWRLLLRLSDFGPIASLLVSVFWLLMLSLSCGLAVSTPKGAFWVGFAVGGSGWMISWLVPWMSPHVAVLVMPGLGAWLGFLGLRCLRSGNGPCGFDGLRTESRY